MILSGSDNRGCERAIIIAGEAGCGGGGAKFFPPALLFAWKSQAKQSKKLGARDPRFRGLVLRYHPRDTSIAMRHCSLAAQSGSWGARRVQTCRGGARISTSPSSWS